MSEPALSIRNLHKCFGPKTVLKDVSLEVPRGQTFALLGRNGAGKTTLIRILLGLIPADGGTVRVLDRDPAAEPIELRRRVGYLAEDQVMYGWMTPIELCRFLEPFYPTWDMRIAEDYLDRFEVPRHGRIRELSKGQTVKLGLAVALAHRPELAILDDPAIGLDPIARKEFNRDLIEHLQAEGRTVVYSSHLLDEVEAVADSVAILHNGRIARHGPRKSCAMKSSRSCSPRRGRYPVRSSGAARRAAARRPLCHHGRPGECVSRSLGVERHRARGGRPEPRRDLRGDCDRTAAGVAAPPFTGRDVTRRLATTNELGIGFETQT